MVSGSKVPESRTTRGILPSKPALDWGGTYLAGGKGNVYFG